MTDHDEAMISEAVRRAQSEDFCLGYTERDVSRHLLHLERTNWTLLVDPDLIEAREIVASHRVTDEIADYVRRGGWDDSEEIDYALEGIKRGRELERDGK